MFGGTMGETDALFKEVIPRNMPSTMQMLFTLACFIEFKADGEF
jgi:hypothetical protein